MIKLATWNVNSLKIRLEQVLSWMDSEQIDILALQETKLTDELFPREAFSSKGFHVVFSGQKTYNGVALISRFPIENIVCDVPGLDDPQRRVLVGTILGMRIINLYVPNGSEVGSEKYQYKLNWLSHLQLFIEGELKQHPQLAVLGDFNIAPDDRDVFDVNECKGGILVSELERQAFFQLIDLGLKDSFRHLHDDTQFSWWDYRAASFRRNRGLRIDHILLSDALKKVCSECVIDMEPRRADRPSDHAPVWVKLDIHAAILA